MPDQTHSCRVHSSRVSILTACSAETLISYTNAQPKVSTNLSIEAAACHLQLPGLPQCNASKSIAVAVIKLAVLSSAGEFGIGGNSGGLVWWLALPLGLVTKLVPFMTFTIPFPDVIQAAMLSCVRTCWLTNSPAPLRLVQPFNKPASC